jgi:hypothetical protein
MRANAFVSFVCLGIIGLTVTVAYDAGATRLPVGAGKTYATPCDAIAVAKPNDTIDVSPGTYTDSCEIDVAGLTLEGVGGQPKVDLSGTNHPASYKGIYVVSADDVRIEGLELTGAHVDDSEGGNAAALRVTGHGLVVHGCNIHDNQNGILAAPLVDGGTITIEYTELSHNGLGDACDQGGCVHNVYISKNGETRYDKAVFQFNWSHDLASDTADKGHLFKSRSRETDVLYNRITGETGHDSYEVDLPNAGLGIVVGNVIEKGTDADNSILLDYGEEGIDVGQETTLYVVDNTFVNDFAKGTFVQVANATTLTAHNNLFVGAGTPSNAGTLSADNLSVDSPMFVNPATYDYHLTAGSPAIGKAVDPGKAGAFSLTPAFEYVQPLLAVARRTAHDLGAFEYGTNTSSAGADAGAIGTGGTPTTDDGGSDGGGPSASSADAGPSVAHSDAGVAVASHDGDPSESNDASAGGCGCLVVGERPDTGVPNVAVGLGLGIACLRRRGFATDPATRSTRRARS